MTGVLSAPPREDRSDETIQSGGRALLRSAALA